MNRSGRTQSWDPRLGPIIIGVAGASGSGKTTMCKEIKDRMGDNERVVIVSLDSYYKGLPAEYHSHPQDYNFDDPKALDFDLLYDHVSRLKDGAKSIEVSSGGIVAGRPSCGKRCLSARWLQLA